MDEIAGEPDDEILCSGMGFHLLDSGLGKTSHVIPAVTKEG